VAKKTKKHRKENQWSYDGVWGERRGTKKIESGEVARRDSSLKLEGKAYVKRKEGMRKKNKTEGV